MHDMGCPVHICSQCIAHGKTRTELAQGAKQQNKVKRFERKTIRFQHSSAQSDSSLRMTHMYEILVLL